MGGEGEVNTGRRSRHSTVVHFLGIGWYEAKYDDAYE